MINAIFEESISKNLPFSCQYDSNTTLIKSGSLVKVVKISSANGSDSGILQAIQNVLSSALYAECDIAIWLSTIRKTVKLSHIYPDVTDNCAALLSKKYEEEISKQNTYRTEFYISIVSSSILEKVGKSLNFLLPRLINNSKAYIDEILARLNQVTEKIFELLQEFSPKLLDAGESMAFFSLLFSVDDENKEPTVIDLSEDILRDKNIIFGFNAFELRLSKKKKFGTVLKVKDYKNIEIPKFIGELLSINAEMIITEVIMRASKSDIAQNLEKSTSFSGFAAESSFASDARLAKMNENVNKKKYSNFYLRSLSITVLSKEFSQLDSYVGNIQNLLLRYGFVVIRYDLLTENAFWSNFPGNFGFLPPSDVVLPQDCGTFACTHTHFLCLNKGTSYLTKFLSISDQVHLFNIYGEDNINNIIIMGEKSSGKTVLQNFLLSQALIKNNIKFLIVDDDNLSEIFIKALNGNYYELDFESKSFLMNIFDINDKSVLIGILSRICTKGGLENKISAVAEKILSLPKEKRNLHTLEEDLSSILGDLTIIKEKFACFFHAGANSVFTSDIIAFSLDKILDINKIASLIAFYLLHKYIESCSAIGEKFIIAIQNEWKFKNLFNSAQDLEQFLSKVSEAGGVLIFSTSDKNNILTGTFSNVLEKYTKTKILIPSEGKTSAKYVKSFFGVSDSEIFDLENAILYDKCFFLRQGDKSITLNFDLSSITESNILSSEGRVDCMRKAIALTSNNPNLWLPIFYKECDRK